MAWEVPNFSIPVNPDKSALISNWGERLIGAYDSGQESRRKSDVLDARKSLAAENLYLPDGSVNPTFAQRLLGAGDLEGARIYQGLGQQQEDRAYRRSRDSSEDAWRREQAARMQSNADRSFSLQQEQMRTGRIPAGYEPDGAGGIRPQKGGPQDPNAIIAERARQAADAGLVPGSGPFKAFLLTGKLPREDAQPLTATDKKAILEADEAVAANRTAIDNLGRAQELSGKALDGFGAETRAWVGNNVPLLGRLAASPEKAQATSELTNTVTTNALSQLKAIFGAAPTEGERAILMQIQGAASQPQQVREAIYRQAQEMARRRLEFNQQRADALRGGNYYQTSGAPQPVAAGGPKNDGLLPGGAPAVGQIENGYRYKGGNPADPASWEKVQ